MGFVMNISQMLKALTDGGMSQNEIAKAIGVSQPTIHRALKGSPMLYDSGKRIEQLYAERVAGPAAQAAAA